MHVGRLAELGPHACADLLAHGFEWTLLYGKPTNQDMHRYKVAPKCCDMRFNRTHNNYICLTPGFRVRRGLRRLSDGLPTPPSLASDALCRHVVLPCR
jgi:hypothetical protein